MATGTASMLTAFPTMRGYRRRWGRRDLLAGITFGAITIPGQLATAQLAGMPPITGLYGFFVACVIGAVISGNRHLALGCDSTVAPILAAGLATFAVAGSPRYVGYVAVTTLLVGIILLIVGVAQLNWVGDLLSKPVVTGFLGGIAVTIVVHQLPGLFGVEATGSLPIPRVVSVIGNLGETSVETLVVGVLALAALLTVPRFAPKFPTALTVLVVATVASTVLNLAGSGVAVLGALPAGLPSITLPALSLDTMWIVLPTAIGVAIICLAQTSATSRTMAALGGYESDVTSDFRAIGAANVASSLVGSFALDASPPSSTILADSRGRTQAAALVAATITLVLILFAGHLIANLPMSILSAVLIYIATKIFRLDDMKAMYHYSWRSFGLMMLTMSGVILLGIEIGLALAVLIAFIYRAKVAARPELLPLGRTDDGAWLPEVDDRSHVPTGVEAYRLNGPLWFGNANWFKLAMVDEIRDGPGKPLLLVLDGTRIDDIDFTGIDALKQIIEVCVLREVTFAMACHIGRTEEALNRGGIARELAGERVFDSVEEAVQTLGPTHRRTHGAGDD